MSNNELSAQQAEELLDTVMIQLAQELLTAKKNGKPLSESLPLIDRLLKHEALRQRRAALRLRERKAAAAAEKNSPKPLLDKPGHPLPAPDFKTVKPLAVTPSMNERASAETASARS